MFLSIARHMTLIKVNIGVTQVFNEKGGGLESGKRLQYVRLSVAIKVYLKFDLLFPFPLVTEKLWGNYFDIKWCNLKQWCNDALKFPAAMAMRTEFEAWLLNSWILVWAASRKIDAL
jgi:hypothetical protein